LQKPPRSRTENDLDLIIEYLQHFDFISHISTLIKHPLTTPLDLSELALSLTYNEAPPHTKIYDWNLPSDNLCYLLLSGDLVQLTPLHEQRILDNRDIIARKER